MRDEGPVCSWVGKNLSSSNKRETVGWRESQTVGQRDSVSVVPVTADTRLHTLWVIVCHQSLTNPSKCQTEQVREQNTGLSSHVRKWTPFWGASECASLWGRQLLEGPRGQGWLLETTGSRNQLREREKVRVCVSDPQSTHWGLDWVSKTGYRRAPQCRCLCVSAFVCTEGGLGAGTSLGICVLSCQKLESLGSRRSYCTDQVSEPHLSLTVVGTHLANVYLLLLMHLHPYQARGIRGWGHRCWDFFWCWVFLFVFICVAEHV